MPKDAKPADDTEKGFGTGLRAQLQRRRDSAQEELDASNEAFESAKALATAPPIANGNGDGHAVLETVRAELAAALAREQDLRAFLTDQIETRERELDVDHELSARSAEVDAKLGTLEAAELELETREHKVAEQLEALEKDRKEVAAAREDLDATRARVAGKETLTSDLQEELDQKLHDLKAADREHEKLAAELGKKAGALEGAEAKLARREEALASHESEFKKRAEAETRRVTEREAAVRQAEKELPAREQQLVMRERELAKEASRVNAKAEALNERDTELSEREARLKDDALRLENELTNGGKAAQEALDRLKQLDARELDLTAREADLGRREAHVGRIESEESRGIDLEELDERLKEREHELAAREREIETEEKLAASVRKQLDKKDKRLTQLEDTMKDRIRELDEREAEVEAREVGTQAESELREDKLERREDELAKLEERLLLKENELKTYVAQVQGALKRREDEWALKVDARDGDDQI